MRKKQKSKISAHLGESFTKPGPQLPGSFSSSLLKSFLFLQNYVLARPLPLRYEEIGQGRLWASGAGCRFPLLLGYRCMCT